jgi:purine-binding chemotaxis protein CheW
MSFDKRAEEGPPDAPSLTPDASEGAAAAEAARGGAAPPAPADAERRALDMLRARARELAAVPTQAPGGSDVEVLVCRLGAEQYALDLTALRGVRPAQGLTPVPCTPAHVAGIVNVRGEVLTVLDLAVVLRVRSAGAPSHNAQIVLAQLPHGRLGLLVSEVLGVARLALDQLDRALSGREYARGVVDARTIYLNLEQLLAGERFEVLEEVT